MKRGTWRDAPQAWALVLATATASGGCSRIEEASLSVADKVNAGYPVSAEVRVAHEQVLGLLGTDARALEAFTAQVRSRMALRALTCSKNTSIGRLDLVASVKSLQLDRRCFQEQDKDLQRFYGIRAIGTLLAKPPLRALKPLGPIATLPKGRLSYIIFGTFARDAGVAVLRDGAGEAVVVEMPGATPIAQLPRAMAQEHNSRLSPNGRVFAVNPMAQGVVFFDTETGNRIWDSADGSRVMTWLPGLDSFILAMRDGSVMIADGHSGSVEPHPVAAKNSAFSAHIGGEPVRTLIGTSHELSLVEHTRGPEGIRATPLKQYRITSGQGITSGNPVPMRSGKMVVFPTVRDVGWLDLDGGTSGTWKTSPTFGIPFAKLDETHLMFDSVRPGSMTLEPWVFDIATEAVAPLDLGGPRGMIVDIGERIGYMRRGNEAWAGDAVVAAEYAPLEQVTSAFELQLQLAKLRALADAQMASAAALQAPAGLSATAPPALVPGLSSVPKDAQVHVVGVYEGKGPAAPSTDRRPKREVRVVVRASSRPIVLVLASYEPVNWVITNAGARVSAVLLSGYHPSNVVGAGNAQVLRIGSAYAYEATGADYLKLRHTIVQYTGALEIKSFQGVYAGADFSVGGN